MWGSEAEPEHGGEAGPVATGTAPHSCKEADPRARRGEKPDAKGPTWEKQQGLEVQLPLPLPPRSTSSLLKVLRTELTAPCGSNSVSPSIF